MLNRSKSAVLALVYAANISAGMQLQAAQALLEYSIVCQKQAMPV